MNSDETIFIQNTIDPDNFQIDNVEGDNACFYRALANYIYYAVPETNINKLKKLNTLNGVMLKRLKK